MKEKAVKYLKEKFSENKSKWTKHYIIIGNFNHTVKNVLDKKGKEKELLQKKSELLDLLVSHRYKNTF